jgi:hypothetical protein
MQKHNKESRTHLKNQRKMHPLVILFCGFVGLNCASIRTNFQPLDQLRESVTSDNTTYDPYLLTSGEWIANQPIMVNRDFDFSMAQALEDAGPGLAANKRRAGNKETASKLITTSTVDWKALFDKQIKECCGCKNLDGSTVRFYALLYGDDKARLQSILEIEQAEESSPKAIKSVYRFIEISKEQSIEGDSAWLSDHGKPILDTMKSAIPKLVSLFQHYGRINASEKTPTAKVGKCPIGGAYRAKGGVIKEDEQKIIMQVDNMKRTILLCENNFSKN